MKIFVCETEKNHRVRPSVSRVGTPILMSKKYNGNVFLSRYQNEILYPIFYTIKNRNILRLFISLSIFKLILLRN